VSAKDPSMSDPGIPSDGAASADWLDRVLADDGFTARVMQTLPAPIAPPAWRNARHAGDVARRERSPTMGSR